MTSVFLAFLISFLLLIFFQYYFQDQTTIRETQFFSRNFDNATSKILLIGSSHVGMLNVLEIEKIVNQNSNDYEIFNLARGSDTPTKQLKKIPLFIPLNPKLVVYGIGYRDFINLDSSNNENFLSEPSKLFKNSLDSELDFLNNPKLTTLNVVRNAMGVNILQNTSMTSTPFFPYAEEHRGTMSLNEIKISYDHVNMDFDIPSVENNSELLSLNIMLNNLKNNDIDVILYITPHNSQYVDKLSDINKKNFNNIIYYIEKTHDVHIYSLLTNYADIEIWTSPNHITHSPEGLIYSQDLATIIFKELTS